MRARIDKESVAAEQREERMIQRQINIKTRETARHKEKEDHELEVLRLQAVALASGHTSVGNVKAPCPKISPFDKSKDN